MVATGLAPFASAGLVPRSTDAGVLLARDTVMKNSTTINKSFTAATLFDGYV